MVETGRHGRSLVFATMIPLLEALAYFGSIDAQQSQLFSAWHSVGVVSHPDK